MSLKWLKVLKIVGKQRTTRFKINIVMGSPDMPVHKLPSSVPLVQLAISNLWMARNAHNIKLN